MWHHIPDEWNCQKHHCKNFRTHNVILIWRPKSSAVPLLEPQTSQFRSQILGMCHIFEVQYILLKIILYNDLFCTLSMCYILIDQFDTIIMNYKTNEASLEFFMYFLYILCGHFLLGNTKQLRMYDEALWFLKVKLLYQGTYISWWMPSTATLIQAVAWLH